MKVGGIQNERGNGGSEERIRLFRPFPRRAHQLLKSLELFIGEKGPEGEFMGFTPPTGGTKRNTAGRATPFRKIILARIRLSNYRTRRITPYSTLCSRIIHPVTQPSRPCNCFYAVFRRRAFPIRRPPPIFFITES